ncbi:hypothetical protein B9J07_27650 [Sinorhizobium sp. LM21]|uniref:hypothetical protein n=1 Tax=Sinorhizobium sp. LM21 TaxID=1449788 RepID=UPI0005D92552|nr:hypothetical protein [Sinorhizobium sp. LM21]AJW30228.1 hypothetical protein pLM21S1_p110 [Sinorhizobium sp. LM21]OWZ90366.1 hypothetical protein B9J07_27650 [Sinorhizobium sp. LM21]
MTEPTAQVISITTRKPWHEEQAEKRKARRATSRKKRKDLDQAKRDHKFNQLVMLDEIRALILEDKFEGLLIVGRDPKTKNFFNDFVLDVTTVPLNDYYAYSGVLQTLAAELQQCATMAPALMSDGTTLDPYLEPPEVIYLEGEDDD